MADTPDVETAGVRRSPAVAADGLVRVAGELVAALTRRGLTVAVAESLTGGMVAARIVDIPGASEAFRGGVVSYATEVKHDVLGVSAPLLRERGAVDPEVAKQMAVGVRRLLKADLGLAVTGVAGPTEQDGHPVGQVFLARCAGPESTTEVREVRLSGSRAQIRQDASAALIAWALATPELV